MENRQLSNSFIPRRSPEKSGRPIGNRRLNLISIISILVFSVSVISALVMFIYQWSMVKNLQLINEKLLSVKSSLDPTFIEELIRLNQRLFVASELFAGHQAVSPIFAFLESATLEQVRFKSLRYSIERGAGRPEISISGEAGSFNAVALQSDIFAGIDVINDPVFRDFTVNESSNVDFNFSAMLDSQAFLYKNILQTGLPSSQNEVLPIEFSTTSPSDQVSPSQSTPVESPPSSPKPSPTNGFDNLPEF